MSRYKALNQYHFIKTSAKRDFDYDRDKLRVDTQRHLGRVAGSAGGTLAGAMAGKSVKGIMAKGLGGAVLGTTAGHYAGPKVFKVEDDVLDLSVRRALIANAKNKGTGKNSPIVKNLKKRYKLKAYKDFSKKASRRDHWTTRPLLSEKSIKKTDNFGYKAAPYALGAIGAGFGGLAVNVPPYVTKGPKPASALGIAIGGATGYGLGKVLQPKGM